MKNVKLFGVLISVLLLVGCGAVGELTTPKSADFENQLDYFEAKLDYFETLAIENDEDNHSLLGEIEVVGYSFLVYRGDNFERHCVEYGGTFDLIEGSDSGRCHYSPNLDFTRINSIQNRFNRLSSQAVAFEHDLSIYGLIAFEKRLDELEILTTELATELHSLLSDEHIIYTWEVLDSPTHMAVDVSTIDERLGDISRQANNLDILLNTIYGSLVNHAMDNPDQFPIICSHDIYISNCPEFDPTDLTLEENERLFKLLEVRRMELVRHLERIIHPFWDGTVG